MSIDTHTFQDRLKTASPLETPFLLMQLEQYDCDTATKILERINQDFAKESLIDNVLNPVMTTIADSLLMLPLFKGLSRELGLSANRIMIECQSFNYDGRILYLRPDSFVEKTNQDSISQKWGASHRPQYDRNTYEDQSKMGHYKKMVAEDTGHKKNLTDEYLLEPNITEKKNNPDLRRNDPKGYFNAETDHIVPLNQIFKQVQNNAGLSDHDIKDIANSTYNFAVTARRINNPKRDLSNSEFIKRQDKLKAQGKPYIKLSQEQRDNMIRMERNAQAEIENGINQTVIKNLTGRGKADRDKLKSTIENKEKELGRKLTQQERLDVNNALGREKAYSIHRENIKSSGKQTLMYAIGSTILFIIKPLYYELKDSFINGFNEGVGTNSFKEAISIRMGRVKDYVWEQLTDIKSVLGSAMDILKNLLSSIIEGVIGMFVGILKKAFRVVKECFKIVTQSYSILFGEAAQNSTPAEKGDAILKILGASATALCGIWIDAMLENLKFIPDDFRGVFSTLLSGVASIIIFYLLDKADIFNAKAERRNKRIQEIFDERIKDLQNATKKMDESVIAALKSQAIHSRKKISQLIEAFNAGDLDRANKEAFAYAAIFKVDLEYNSIEDFENKRAAGSLKWDM